MDPRPLDPITLAGRYVRLEPIAPEHVDALEAAALIDPSTYTYTGAPKRPGDAARYVEVALAQQAAGQSLVFVQRRTSDGVIVGSTRFVGPERWDWPLADGHPDVIEVGYTWLAADAQRSGINTEAKLLLATHAFETWHVRRLWLRTDARNERSRAAMSRIGFVFEGVLRNQMPSYTGPEPRDSAVFSATDSEWPELKARIESLLR